MKRTAYRLTWKREGYEPKRKLFRSRVLALRRMRLLGPEPWTADPRVEDGKRRPEDYDCCDGYECGCAGLSIRDAYLERRKSGGDYPPPPIEWIRLEERTVTETPWESCGFWQLRAAAVPPEPGR
jgi:hypothetical protein